MTRGKYANRAANRQAEAEAATVAELKEQLRAVTEERDATRADLECARRDLYSHARHVAADLAADHVLQLQQQLRDLEQARQDDRVRLAREVFDLLSRLGAGMELEGWGQLAELFGQGHRVGELVTLGNPDRTRGSAGHHAERASRPGVQHCYDGRASAVRITHKVRLPKEPKKTLH
jgi:hypothetical protein